MVSKENVARDADTASERAGQPTALDAAFELPSFGDEPTHNWFTVGVRLHPDDVRRVDLARVYGGFKDRNEFCKTVLLERVIELLREHGASLDLPPNERQAG